ncbi:MAG: hypothetical protein E7214_06140 [Clostridium sp.]|nr:hypothetical protein [Clostridium sp.]
MRKIFYISDYHFYHELTIKRSRHIFNNVEEMNEEIIRRHNARVSEDDDVYILGDIIVCDEENLSEYMEKTVGRLKGKLHLIIGNHDLKYLDKEEFRKYFESIDESKIILDHKKWVHLCHYPMLLWYKKNKGAYNVFGHMHNEKVTKEFDILRGEENALNACVEVNNYTPCLLEEIKQNNILFKSTLDNDDFYF